MAPIKQRMSAKHPTVVRDYFLNAANLLQAGVTVASATAVATPSGLTVGTPVVQTPANTQVKARVSGGTDGVDYTVLWTLTLSDGEIEVAIMIIPVSSTVEY